MHSKYHRRFAVEQALRYKRLPTPLFISVPETSSHDMNDGVALGDIDGFTLTGPITITLVTTVQPSTSPTATVPISPPVDSASPTSSWTSQSTTDLATTITTTSPIINTESDALQDTASTTAPASTSSSSIITHPTPSASASNNGQKLGGLAEPNNGLSGGAIAGVVIAVILLFIGAGIFLIRKRLMRMRKKRMSNWTRPITQFANRDVEYHTANAAPRAPLGRIPPPAPPAMSYNGRDNAPSIIVTSPGAGPIPSGPHTETVKCTFLPRLPDELAISVGEVIRVLAEYDDGWALCTNAYGEKGMVPLECFGRGGGLEAGRNFRRVSSLAPTR